MIKVEILNRQARHNYFIEDTYECGIVLRGTEVKSIRAGKCHLKDSYGIVRNGEIFLLNMFISPYKEGNIFNEKETRTRKLLLHKSEIRKLNDEVKFIVVLFFIFISCGCGKKSLSPVEFTRKMEEKKYVVTDLSNKKNKIILAVGSHYQVYYYQYDSEDLIKKALETEFILLKDKYEVENNDIYIVYSKIGNTYVYIGAPKRYKNEVIDLLKYIGY